MTKKSRKEAKRISFSLLPSEMLLIFRAAEKTCQKPQDFARQSAMIRAREVCNGKAEAEIATILKGLAVRS